MMKRPAATRIPISTINIPCPHVHVPTALVASCNLSPARKDGTQGAYIDGLEGEGNAKGSTGQAQCHSQNHSWMRVATSEMAFTRLQVHGTWYNLVSQVRCNTTYQAARAAT